MKNSLVIDDDGNHIWYYAGDTVWYKNGVKHREDGPAIEWASGFKCWYLNGLRHRVDGPAEVWANGDTVWWLHGEELFHPESFPNMESWIEYLNGNEEESYQAIHDINGLIGFIDNPSAKQLRLHQMRWVL